MFPNPEYFSHNAQINLGRAGHWASKRKFPVLKVGRLVRVAPAALEEWIRDNTDQIRAGEPKKPVLEAKNSPKWAVLNASWMSFVRERQTGAKNDPSRLDFRGVFPYYLGHGG